MFTREGFGKGFTVQSYQQFGVSVPLLSSFYFRYDFTGNVFEPPHPVDNKIQGLRILPGGISEDLSPNADLSASEVEDGKIDIELADSDPGGRKTDTSSESPIPPSPLLGLVASSFVMWGVAENVSKYSRLHLRGTVPYSAVQYLCWSASNYPSRAAGTIILIRSLCLSTTAS